MTSSIARLVELASEVLAKSSHVIISLPSDFILFFSLSTR